MNKLIFKIGIFVIIFGLIPSTIWAVDPVQVQIPDFLRHNNINPSKKQIVPIGDLKIDYKVMVTKKLDKWTRSLNKATNRIENSKYLSAREKEAVLDVIKDAKKDIDDLKKSVNQSQDFDENDANDTYDNIDKKFVKVQNNIHKTIKKSRIDHQQIVLDKLKALSNKMKIYIDTADKNGLDTQKAEIKLTEMNAQLSTASDKLEDAESRINNVNEDVALDTSYRYFQKCNNDLKAVQQSLVNAKSLGKDVLKELRKVIKNQ
jgi:hypothetical protein